ncbi:MAG TPA: hypothetical protein QF753_19570 [Victivallales bacterium]|nr:hypothetical protein [Victivallales bacterium]
MNNNCPIREKYPFFILIILSVIAITFVLLSFNVELIRTYNKDLMWIYIIGFIILTLFALSKKRYIDICFFVVFMITSIPMYYKVRLLVPVWRIHCSIIFVILIGFCFVYYPWKKYRE